ncbi:hypothetical protein [Nocardia sp. IFM 10818]
MLVLLCLVVGAAMAVQSFSTLNLVGPGPLTGIVASFASTRELGLRSVPFVVTTRVIAGAVSIVRGRRLGPPSSG